MMPEGCVETGQCDYAAQCQQCTSTSTHPTDSTCYQVPDLDGECGGYWSTTHRTFNKVWKVYYPRAYVYDGSTSAAFFRCVRAEKDEAF